MPDQDVGTIQERVASRYILATTENPFSEWLQAMPAVVEDLRKTLAAYEEIERRLVEIQTAVDSPPLGREVKAIQKGLARLRSLPEQVQRVATDLTELSREYRDAVKKAVAESKADPKGEFEWDLFRPQIGPLLGDCRKLDLALSNWGEWAPSEGEIEDINSVLESRKLAAIVKLFEKVTPLDENNPFYDIAEFLSDIDANFESDVSNEV